MRTVSFRLRNETDRGVSADRTSPFPDTLRHLSRTVSPEPRSRTRTGCHRNEPHCPALSLTIVAGSAHTWPVSDSAGDLSVLGRISALPFLNGAWNALDGIFPSLLATEVPHATRSKFSLSAPTTDTCSGRHLAPVRTRAASTSRGTTASHVGHCTNRAIFRDGYRCPKSPTARRGQWSFPGKISDNAREAPQVLDERTPGRPAADVALHVRKSLTQRDDPLCPDG